MCCIVWEKIIKKILRFLFFELTWKVIRKLGWWRYKMTKKCVRFSKCKFRKIYVQVSFSKNISNFEINLKILRAISERKLFLRIFLNIWIIHWNFEWQFYETKECWKIRKTILHTFHNIALLNFRTKNSISPLFEQVVLSASRSLGKTFVLRKKNRYIFFFLLRPVSNQHELDV